MLALHARMGVHREPLLERDVEQLHVHKVRVALRHHPNVVREDHTRDQVYEIVATQTNHQSGLADAGQQRKLGKTLPAIRFELQEVDHAATDMTREEEVICLAIRYCDRVEAWELP